MAKCKTLFRIFLVFSALCFCSCGGLSAGKGGKVGTNGAQTEPPVEGAEAPQAEGGSEAAFAEEPEEPAVLRASFVAVGDNLIHEPIYKQAEARATAARAAAEEARLAALEAAKSAPADAAENAGGGAPYAADSPDGVSPAPAEPNGASAQAENSAPPELSALGEASALAAYDFAEAYKYVLPYVAFSDFAFINQETLITPSFAPSTYPRFCSPPELGDFLVDSGFNMISLANNHMLDKGDEGLRDTLGYWRGKSGVVFSGAFTSDEDRRAVRYIERNGIKLAFVAISDTLNGLSLEAGSELRLLRVSQTQIIEQYLREARQTSDFVVVSVHWGEEYSTEPNAAQKKLAQQMADWGADAIIGTHPHVLQPVEELEAEDGRSVLVAYSLGNFISAQSEGMRIIGGLLSFQLEKDSATQATRYTDVALLPLVTHYDAGFANLAVYPLEAYAPSQARKHGVKRFTSGFNYNYVTKNTKKIIDEKYLVLPEAVIAQSNKRLQIWIMRQGM